MTTVDWIAVAVIAIAALVGLRRGLIGGLLGLAGIAVGAYIGAKLAPELLSGSESPYTPLVALGGAAVARDPVPEHRVDGRERDSDEPVRAAAAARRSTRSAGSCSAPSRARRSSGSSARSRSTFPVRRDLREQVQQSRILGEINARVPPSRLLDAIARVDPFLAIQGPEANVAPPDPALLASPAVRDARSQCLPRHGQRLRPRHLRLGLGRGAEPRRHQRPRRRRDEGSHASTCATATTTMPTSSPSNAATTSPCFASPGSARRRFGRRPRSKGQAVAILGYPENGPSPRRPGGSARPRVVLTEDAYGRGPVNRKITTLRGRVRHGNSGGPAVDNRGRVRTTVFAARVGADNRATACRADIVQASPGRGA